MNGKNLGELVLQPSRIYTRAIVDMIGGVESKPQAKVHGVAHITGGGIPGKLGRILKPQKLGAQIDSPFPPGDIISFCQALGNVSDQEAYRAWNMGQGMIVVTPEPEGVIQIARNHRIKAKIIGRVTKNSGHYYCEPRSFQKRQGVKIFLTSFHQITKGFLFQKT